MDIQSNAAAGFDLGKFLLNIQDVFEKAFFVNDPAPVLKSVLYHPTGRYAPTHALWENPDTAKPNPIMENLNGPACILDLYQVTSNAETHFSDTGNLNLYAHLRAIVLVQNVPLENPHYRVRQLAFDVAGLVTEQTHFGTPSGMSQVNSVREAEEIERQHENILGWIVEWQHLIEIHKNDYSRPELREFLPADAMPYNLNINVKPKTSVAD